MSLRSSNVTYSIFVWLLATNISSRVPSVALAPVLVGGRCSSSLKRPWLVNLPGWRWATIKQVALDRLSRSLHSDVCDSDGCCDAVLHSTISGRGSRRERAALNISFKPTQGHPSNQPHAVKLRDLALRPSRSCGDGIATSIKLGRSYLLGLLAMIKCSICSYQCDN